MFTSFLVILVVLSFKAKRIGRQLAVSLPMVHNLEEELHVLTSSF